MFVYGTDAVMKDKNPCVQRILPRQEVAALLDLSLTTLWREVRAGRFPRAVRISPGRVGWPAQIVRRWIDERIDGTGEWPDSGRRT